MSKLLKCTTKEISDYCYNRNLCGENCKYDDLCDKYFSTFNDVPSEFHGFPNSNAYSENYKIEME